MCVCMCVCVWMFVCVSAYGRGWGYAFVAVGRMQRTQEHCFRKDDEGYGICVCMCTWLWGSVRFGCLGLDLLSCSALEVLASVSGNVPYDFACHWPWSRNSAAFYAQPI